MVYPHVMIAWEKEKADFKPPLRCNYTQLRKMLLEHYLTKNPKSVSVRQSVVAVNLVLTALATLLMPNCNSLTVHLDPAVTWRRGITA